jgi:glycosyltransferase involved in cell wall biosynthesis
MLIFSVIIPCFNIGEYINHTLQSVLSQDFDLSFEVILIDDCSTDDTLKHLQFFEEKYENVKIFLNDTNRGVSYTRNRGIKEANGDFVFFLDGDDCYEPSLFRSIYQVSEKRPDIDLFVFSFKKEFKGIYKSYSAPKYDLCTFKKEDFLQIYFRRLIYQCMCSFAVKRNTLIENSIFFSEDIYSGEDQEFQIKCYLNSKGIYYFSNDFFVYRFREESIMNSFFSDKRVTALEVYSRITSEISKKNLPDSIQQLFNSFSMFEFFSVLKSGLKSNNKDIVKRIINYDSILLKNMNFDVSMQFLVVYLLRMFYKIHPSIAFFILKYVVK